MRARSESESGIRGTVKYYPGSFPDPLPELVKAPRVASQGGRGPIELPGTARVEPRENRFELREGKPPKAAK